MLDINQILQERERKRREKRTEKIKNLKQKLGKLEFKSKDFDLNLIRRRALRLDKLKALLKQIDENHVKLKETVQTMSQYVTTDDSYLNSLKAIQDRET